MIEKLNGPLGNTEKKLNEVIEKYDMAMDAIISRVIKLEGTGISPVGYIDLATHNKLLDEARGQAKVVEKECEHLFSLQGDYYVCKKCGDTIKDTEAKPASGGMEEVIEKCCCYKLEQDKNNTGDRRTLTLDTKKLALSLRTYLKDKIFMMNISIAEREKIIKALEIEN